MERKIPSPLMGEGQSGGGNNLNRFASDSIPGKTEVSRKEYEENFCKQGIFPAVLFYLFEEWKRPLERFLTMSWGGN
jgi:hypothetical protein